MMQEQNHRRPMTRWPAKDGMKNMTIQLRSDLADHLDRRAEYLGMSRTSYLRQLVIQERRRGPVAEWPDQDAMKPMTIQMRNDLVEYIDQKAQYMGMRRVSYLRQLVIQDMQRQGPAPAAAKG